MTTEVTSQIIETSGIIIAPIITILLTYWMLKRLMRIRQRFDYEADLLREALFYRMVIAKYAEFCSQSSPNQTEYKKEFWEQAKQELDMPSPERTQPARIKKRLADLDLLSERVSKIIDKLQ